MNTIQSESRSEVAPGVFAHVRPMPVEGVEEGEAYTAFVSWFANADGEVLGKYTCTCTTSGCNESKTCDLGESDCFCARCRLTCK